MKQSLFPSIEQTFAFTSVYASSDPSNPQLPAPAQGSGGLFYWFLIILFASTLIYALYKRRVSKKAEEKERRSNYLR